MAFFDKFRTSIEGLRQTADYHSLIAVLDGEEPGSRVDAAQALSASGGFPPSPTFSRDSRMPTASHGPGCSGGRWLRSALHPSPLLLALTLRASPTLQASITRAIAETGDSMFEALLLALHHKQPAVRRAAVLAIRGGMGKKAIPPLVEAFHDNNYPVRKEAAGALAALRWVPDELPEKVWYYFLLEDWTELAKLQAAAVPVLFKGLGSKEHRIRSESVRALGKIRDSRVIPALIRALEDPQMDVRVRAASARGDRQRPGETRPGRSAQRSLPSGADGGGLGAGPAGLDSGERSGTGGGVPDRKGAVERTYPDGKGGHPTAHPGAGGRVLGCPHRRERNDAATGTTRA